MTRTRLVAGGMIAIAFAVGGLAGMAVEESLGLDWFDFLDEDEVDRALPGRFGSPVYKRRAQKLAAVPKVT